MGDYSLDLILSIRIIFFSDFERVRAAGGQFHRTAEPLSVTFLRAFVCLRGILEEKKRGQTFERVVAYSHVVDRATAVGKS